MIKIQKYELKLYTVLNFYLQNSILHDLKKHVNV